VTLPPDSAARSNSFKASAEFSAPKAAYPATGISAPACSTTAICSPGSLKSADKFDGAISDVN